MFQESLIILWDHTSAYFVASCLVSILAFLIAYQYTKNLNIKTSSAIETNTPVQTSYMEPTEVEHSEQEEKNQESDLNNAAGDSKIEEIRHESKGNDIRAGAGGDNLDGDDELMNPGREFYMAPEKIPNNLKKAKEKMVLHQMETSMSEDQKILERKIQREQLSEIFKLVEEQSDKYGINSLADMEEQMKLYKN